MDLDKLAIKNSSWTWNRLREARNLDYQIGEESITDFIILNMKKWGGEKLKVETFTRNEESINGSDWEWWFTGLSGKWLGIRVQAKVINLSSEKYEHIHYKNKHDYQVNLLINDAKKSGLIPLYCMYSNWDVKKYKIKSNCKTHKPSVRHYGNSILSPDIVKKLQNKNEKNLNSFIKYLQPLHCIFCCNGYGGTDLPERAYNYLMGKQLIAFDKENESSFLKNEPPHYIKQLERKTTKNNFDINDERLKRFTIIREIEN